MEIALVLLVLVVGLAPLAWRRRGAGLWGLALAAIMMGLVAAAGFGWSRRTAERSRSEEELTAAVPRPIAEGTFASSAKCRSCHPQEYASWHASFHRQMTQVARPETVLGPFDGSSIEFEGHKLRMVRRGDELWVESSPIDKEREAELATGAEGDHVAREPTARRVVMTTGAHHMQLYWAASGAGNLLDELPLVYIREEQPGKSRWAPLEASYLSPTPPGVEPQTHWNTSCLLCHSTGGNPRLDAHTGAADTRVAELGISCEACHGPAEEHVRRYQDPTRRYSTRSRAAATEAASHDGAGASPGARPTEDHGVLNPVDLGPTRSAQVCGFCHAAASFVTDRLVEDWFSSGSGYRPGDDLTQTRLAVLPAHLSPESIEAHRNYNPFFDGSYWPDGMIRVAGREYNGLLESTCYQQGGMTCLSCHSMHHSDPNDQLAAGMDGNQACYQCHASYREKLTAHTHHEASSSGSLCYNCHMPHTTYGLFKAIRSHQISSPNMTLALRTGRPNGCNTCHLDQTLAWTGQKLTEWYEQPAVEFDEEQQTISAAALWLLKGDSLQRALLAWFASWDSARQCAAQTLAHEPAGPRSSGANEPSRSSPGTQWLAPLLAELLNDESPVIRLVSWRSLQKLDPRYAQAGFDFIAPPADRAAAAARVAELGRELPLDERRQAGPRRLFLPDGTSDRKTIRKLIEGRSQRRVRVNE